MRMPCSASAGQQLVVAGTRVWRARLLAHARADRVDRLASACGRPRRGVVDAGVDLVVQAGDADHEELVEVLE